MRKRIFSLFLVLCLIVSLMPTTAFAAENTTVSENTLTTPAPAPVCNCTDKCTSETINSDCPVCSAEGADLSACVGTEAQKTEVTTETTTETAESGTTETETQKTEPTETKNEAGETTPESPETVSENEVVPKAIPKMRAMAAPAPAATNYQIWVGGVEVTSDNASSITGPNISGTASYDAASNTLTLNNANITGATDASGNSYGIMTYVDLNILLAEGSSNTVTAGEPNNDMNCSAGIFIPDSPDSNSKVANLTIQGNGSLTTKSETTTGQSCGIYNGNVTINGATVSMKGSEKTNKYNCGIFSDHGTLTIQNGARVTAESGEGVFSYGIRVKNLNVYDDATNVIVNGGYSYNWPRGVIIIYGDFNIYGGNGKISTTTAIESAQAIGEQPTIATSIPTSGAWDSTSFSWGSEAAPPSNFTVTLGNVETGFDTFDRAWTEAQKSTADTPAALTMNADYITNVADTGYSVAAGQNITLDLNGHEVNAESSGLTFSVQNTASFTLTDSSSEGLGKLIRGSITNNGQFIMNGGTITGNTATNGGGVYNAGTFILEDGTITGNTATIYGSGRGGGVYNEGTFTMNGGSITNNTAFDGGGVYSASGVINIENGEISNNRAYDVGGSGGGMDVQNTDLTMNGGSITKNFSSYGGGINFDSNTKTFTMNDGTISKNESLFIGGGISVITRENMDSGVAKFIMNGGEISNNTTSLSGGGISIIDADMTMNGGTIRGNKGNTGGGLCIDGSYENMITLGGGSITDNTAVTTTSSETTYKGMGGGVYYRTGTVALRGSINISGNECNGVISNFFLCRGKTISVSGFVTNTPIGITTEVTPTVDNPIAITDGRLTFPDSYFTSDSPNYEVAFDTRRNVAVLRVKDSNTDNFAVTHNGSTTEYQTFDEAWAAALAVTSTADTPAIVKMGADAVTNTNYEVADGKYIVLDLNDHTINIENHAKEAIFDVYGTFALVDNGLNSSGTIDGSSSDFTETTVIAIKESGSFIMKGGTITGYKGNNFPYVIVNTGIFLMEGGSITDNESVQGCISNFGTFEMSGGTISNNKAGIGGGVLNLEGNFTMSGGKISDNQAVQGGGLYSMSSTTISGTAVIVNNSTFIDSSAYPDDLYFGGGPKGAGGGIYFNAGTITLDGNAKISGNKCNGVNNNLFLPSGKTVSISGVSNSPSIGITTETVPTKENPVAITSGMLMYPEQYFTSDNSAYEVASDTDSGAAVLQVRQETGNTGSGSTGNGNTGSNNSGGNNDNQDSADTLSTPALKPIAPAPAKPVAPKPAVPNRPKRPIKPVENKTDIEEPFIKGKADKEGWTKIKGDLVEEVEKLTENSDTKVVTVDMNGASVVPGNVLDTIKGKDITVIFDMDNGMTWSVDGKSITADSINDIDFSVATDSNAIPVDVINEVSGERYSMNLSLSYNGEFGFEAVLTVNMGKKNVGLFANLFYYNEKTGELEFICADEINADGNTELTFTHASEYTIVVDKESMEFALAETEGSGKEEAIDTTIDSEELPTSAQTFESKDSNGLLLGSVILVLILIAGIGVVIAVRKKDE